MAVASRARIADFIGACGIIEQVADLIGPEAMTAVTTELLTAATPAGWEAWLEAVALQPFDEELDKPVDVAARLLIDHGIAEARAPTSDPES